MNELTGSSVFRAASHADAKAAPMTSATGESAATGVSSMEQGMVFATANGLPPAQGLYDSRNEHDACGVGFVANMHNAKRTNWCAWACRSCSISTIAARSAPTRWRATAAAS